MVTQQVIIGLGWFAGIVHGVLSSLLYLQERGERDKAYVKWAVCASAIALWPVIGLATAQNFVKPTWGALASAVLGAVFFPLITFPNIRLSGIRQRLVLRMIDVSVLGLFIGAIIGTAPRESFAGALVGMIIGILIAAVLIASGLRARWNLPSATSYTGWRAALVNTVYLAVGGALLGASVEIVLDSSKMLTRLIFP